MTTGQEIENFINSQPEPKRTHLEILHRFLLDIFNEEKLWFLDGKNAEGKVVSNPNIGYGKVKLKYSDNTSKVFYKIGLSTNKTGISVYFMGLEDRNFLRNYCAEDLGKASITGYCIKFKSISEINIKLFKSLISEFHHL